MARTFGTSNANYLSNATALSSFIANNLGTVSLWARITDVWSSVSNVYDLPALFGDTGGFMGIHWGPVSSVDRIWAYNFDTTVDTVSTTYSLNTWYHLAWTHGGGTLRLYKDGTEAGNTASGNTGTMTGTLRVGRNLVTSFHIGQLAEVAVWNVELSAAEIAGLARGMSPFRLRRSSQTGFWPIWGLHSPESDFSGNSRHLTINGTLALANHAPVSPHLFPPPVTETQDIAVASAGQPTMRRWGGVPHLGAGQGFGRTW